MDWTIFLGPDFAHTARHALPVDAQQTVRHFEADLRAVVQPGLHLVNLPKPESVQDVLAAAQALARAEAANAVTQPIGMLLNIESPRALRQAHALATAHARVMGLQLGLGDLFEPLAIDRRDADVVRLAMFTLRARRSRSVAPWPFSAAWMRRATVRSVCPGRSVSATSCSVA